MDASWQAQGNLDSLQIAAQQHALGIAVEQHQLAVQASSFRLQTQRQAEETATEKLRMTTQQQFTAPIEEYTGTAGGMQTNVRTDGR